MSTETTPKTEEPMDPTAATPAPDPTTPPALSGQEAIEAEFSAAQDADIAAALAEADGENAGETGGTGTGAEETPAAAQPPAEVPPAAEPPAGTPPESGHEEPPATPPDGADAIAKARLDAERAAAGRFGGELEKQKRRIAELEAQLAQANQGRKPPESTPTPPAQPETPAAIDPDAPITDEERAVCCGEGWKEDWGQDGADAEVRKQRRIAQRYLGGRGGGDIQKAVQEALATERAQAARDAAMDRFERDLEAAVPGAKALDGAADSNGFGAYLDGFQPGTALTRRAVVEDALGRIGAGAKGDDYERARQVVVDVFKGFGAKAPAQPQTSTRGPAVKAAALDPARYVSPSVGGGLPPAPGTAAAKTYTRKAVDAYLDRAAGQGEDAYQKAFAWVCQQEAAGNIVD